MIRTRRGLNAVVELQFIFVSPETSIWVGFPGLTYPMWNLPVVSGYTFLIQLTRIEQPLARLSVARRLEIRSIRLCANCIRHAGPATVKVAYWT